MERGFGSRLVRSIGNRAGARRRPQSVAPIPRGVPDVFPLDQRDSSFRLKIIVPQNETVRTEESPHQTLCDNASSGRCFRPQNHQSFLDDCLQFYLIDGRIAIAGFDLDSTGTKSRATRVPASMSVGRSSGTARPGPPAVGIFHHAAVTRRSRPLPSTDSLADRAAVRTSPARPAASTTSTSSVRR